MNKFILLNYNVMEYIYLFKTFNVTFKNNVIEIKIVAIC